MGSRSREDCCHSLSKEDVSGWVDRKRTGTCVLPLVESQLGPAAVEAKGGRRRERGFHHPKWRVYMSHDA